MCFSSASTKCSSRRSRATPARPRNVAVESNRYARAHMSSAVWANQRDRRGVCNEPNRSTAQRSGCSRRRRHSDTAEAQRDSFDPHTHAPPRPSHACAAIALYSAGSSASPTGPVRTSGRSSQRARVRAGLAHLRERRELLHELLERLECLRARRRVGPGANAWPCTGRHPPDADPHALRVWKLKLRGQRERLRARTHARTCAGLPSGVLSRFCTQ